MGWSCTSYNQHCDSTDRKRGGYVCYIYCCSCKSLKGITASIVLPAVYKKTCYQVYCCCCKSVKSITASCCRPYVSYQYIRANTTPLGQERGITYSNLKEGEGRRVGCGVGTNRVVCLEYLGPCPWLRSACFARTNRRRYVRSACRGLVVAGGE